MATDGWRSRRSLSRQIRDNSGSFDFFQLVQLLKLELEQSATSARRGLEPGSDRGFRFTADLGADFPASDIRYVGIPARRRGIGRSDTRLLAGTSNYCIAGYSGPLPEGFTDWIKQQQRDGNHATVDFLDIFNHRINLLRYEARAASEQALDRRHPTENLLADGISAVMGMATEGLYEQVNLSRRSLMSLAGMLANHRVGAHLIQRVLQKCFSVPIRVRDLVGAWKDIAVDQLCHLGRSASTLGELCILGRQTWDMRARMRASVGPLPFHELLTYLPDFTFRGEVQSSRTHGAFVALLRFLTNRSVDVDVRLEVDPETVPPGILECPQTVDQATMRLGQSAWLGKPQRDDRFTGFLVTGLGYNAGGGIVG